MKMKYIVEIEAYNIDSLIEKLVSTGEDLARDPKFVERMKKKKINTVFFTRFAAISVKTENTKDER